METLEENKFIYGKVHVNPFWNLKHRNLTYSNEPFNDPETQAAWCSLGFTQTKFTGDMYDMRNPEPDWIDAFRLTFPWQHFSWSVYRMGPGTILPEHKDTYTRFRQIHNITNANSIRRAIIFLEDWQSGHYLEIDGIPITQWVAGDGIFWQNDTPHIAANIGKTDRYTLQITGVLNHNWRHNESSLV